jgi:hypothetical protein
LTIKLFWIRVPTPGIYWFLYKRIKNRQKKFRGHCWLEERSWPFRKVTNKCWKKKYFQNPALPYIKISRIFRRFRKYNLSLIKKNTYLFKFFKKKVICNFCGFSVKSRQNLWSVSKVSLNYWNLRKILLMYDRPGFRNFFSVIIRYQFLPERIGQFLTPIVTSPFFPLFSLLLHKNDYIPLSRGSLIQTNFLVIIDPPYCR